VSTRPLIEPQACTYYISSILVYVSIPYFLWTGLTHDPSSTFYSRRWPPLPPTYLNLDNGTLPHITFASTTDLLHPAPISSTPQSCGSASSQSNRTKWHHSFSDFLCAPFLKCLSEFKNSTHFKSYHCILCPRTTLTWKSLS
jgi:hypothetical protein